MAPTPTSIIYALCLLLLLDIAHGRILLQTHVDKVSGAAPCDTWSFLDATSSTTTNSYDVTGVMTLINQFPHLSGIQFPAYTEDPCYPQRLSWIACSNDPISRVTALYLSYENLYGYLPDFSNMDALERIELQGNYLRGSIPEFLGYLPELTYLNLAYNSFTGRIPYSLANNKRITLNVAGNYGLCNSSYSCSSPSPPFRYGKGNGNGNGNGNGSPTDFKLPKSKPKIRSSKVIRKLLFGLIAVAILVVIGSICACCCPQKKPPDSTTAAAPPPPPDTTTAGAPQAN